MKKYYNTDERYGDCGPFEAESREELVDGMMPTFRDWAIEQFDRDEETDEPRDEYIEAAIETMKKEFFNALEEQA